MSSLDRGSYNYRRSSAKSDALQQMQDDGRQPIYGPQGNLTEFASRPGAPHPANDRMQNNNIVGEFGTPEHNTSWNAFFHNSPAPASNPVQSGVDADSAFGGGTTSYGTNVISNPVASSIAQNSHWLSSRGIDFPPPPTPRSGLFPTGTNPMQFPSNDPARMKSGFVGQNGVDSGYASRVSGYNADLYKPADTMQSSRQPAAAPAWPTGWQGPTKPVMPGNYTSQYGTASVSNFPRTPPLPASTYIWGQNNNG